MILVYPLSETPKMIRKTFELQPDVIHPCKGFLPQK